MNWFESTEKKRTLLLGGLVFICATILLVTARRNIFSYDGFWHLQAGLGWLNHGLSPWLDHYSFTFSGMEIAGPPYLFQAMLGWLVKQFGLEPGFQIYRFGSFFLLFGLFCVFLKKLRAPVIIYCLVLPLVVVLLQFRALVRPELLAYSFSAVAVMLYYRARNELSANGMLPIIGLMLLWSNYHTSIIGYVIFFGFFVDIALKQIRESAPVRAWLRWLAWGLAILAVGFMKPGFSHTLGSLFTFSPEWAKHLNEYYGYELYFRVAAFYALIVVCLITLALLVWKRQAGLLIVCSVLIFQSFMMPRLITPAGIVVLCIFAWAGCEADLKERLRSMPGWLCNVTGGIALILVVLSLGSGIQQARGFMEENRVATKRYPEDVTDYMVERDISGRVFNEFAIGGYLIYRLSPDSQVYIDGRTNILYPIDHLEQYIEAIKSPDVLRSEIEKYNIDLAVLSNNLDPFSLFHNSGHLALDFVGATFSLFRKENPNFPVLGMLMTQPACWSMDLSNALELEKSRAESILPDDSMLFPFINLVLEYTVALDKAAYLNSMEEKNLRTVVNQRFAGYQALNMGLYPLALERFAGLNNWEFRDFLAGAMTFIHLGEWKKSEQLLDSASRHDWPNMKFDDLVILHGLLAYISENSRLELFDDTYLDQLAGQLGRSADTPSSLILNPHVFCPDV